MSLKQVISSVGEARYKKEWTNKELEPSRLPSGFRPDKTYISRIKSASSLQTSRPPYALVLTLYGPQTVPDKKSANKLWEETKPKLLKIYEQEKQASARLSIILEQLRQAIFEGLLEANRFKGFFIFKRTSVEEYLRLLQKGL